MSLRIKICGLTTIATLAATIEAGADMAGFMFFAKSPRHISWEAAGELGAFAAGKIEKVAVIVDAADDAIASIIETLRPDVLQLHGHETGDRIAAIRQRFGVPVMKAAGVADVADIAMASSFVAFADRLLFDAKPPKGSELPGGNGLAFDWRLMRGLQLEKPWMLSGGLTTDNVAQAIEISGAPGVDVSSGVESAPGVKDVEKIAAFVASARAACNHGG